ncbi:MAG: hypothetical protein ACIARR_07090 [Phycisphaerales bacterium JB059]
MTDTPLTRRDFSHLGDPPPFPLDERRLVLVASYPRSGSNWVGRVLEHVLLERVGWSDPIARGRRGVFHDLDRFVSEGRLGELERWAGASALVLKTHRTPEALAAHAPGWLERADQVVGVIRHPGAVMASVLRFLLWSGGIEHDGERVEDLGRAHQLGLVEPFVEAFLEHRGHAPFEAMGFGAGGEHAGAWDARLVPPTGRRLVYARLTRDPVRELAPLLGALGLDHVDSSIERALRACSPQKIASQFGAGFVSTPLGRDDPLTHEQRARAERCFEGEIARYGLGG